MAALDIGNHGIFGLLNHMHSVSELRPKSFSSFAVEFKCSGWLVCSASLCPLT